MSVRQCIAGLALVAGLLVSNGCCHRHKQCCSPCSRGACNACYASPASKVEVPVPVNQR